MSSITVSDVCLSEADFINLSLRLTRQRRWIMRGVVVLTIAYFSWTSSTDLPLLEVLAIYGTLAILLLSGSYWQERQRLRKQYASTPLLQQKTTYLVTPEGITSQSMLASCEIHWANVKAIQEIGPWYFANTSPGTGLLLDSRCVQPPHSTDDLAQALLQKGVNTIVSTRQTTYTAEPSISFVGVRPTLAQYLWISLRLTFRLLPMIWVIAIPFVTGLFGLVTLLTDQTTLIETWQHDKGKLVMLAFTLGMPLLLLYSSWRQYRTTPLWQNLTDYTLTSSSMRMESAIGKTEISWEAVKAAHHLGSWVFLQTASANGYLLDMRRLVDPATKSDVDAWLRAQQVVIK